MQRCGTTVANDFGSVAGEVAICRQTVGIVDRSDLVKHELHGAPDRLADAVEQLVGAPPVPQTAQHAGMVWACPFETDRVMLLADPCDSAALHAEVARLPEGVHGHDISSELAALAVVGPHAESLLARAGLETDGPLTQDEFRAARIDAAPCHVLCETPEAFLLLVHAPLADDTWHALHDAGSDLRVGSVGHEAYVRVVASQRAAVGRVPSGL